MTNAIGLVWLILLVAALSFLQRRLHLETQSLFFLITRRKEIALILFSLLLFPGVLLHECSHYLMARILGVRTGKFSIAPQTMTDGRLRLGFVEAASTDFLRDGLIGIAPFLVGGAFVVYIGRNYLGLEVIWEGLLRSEFVMIWNIFPKLFSQTDFWLWFYFAFAISSTMFPSESDRRAWLPLGLILMGLILLLFFIEGQVSSIAVIERLSRYLNHAVNTVNSVLVISLIIHFLVFPFVWLFRNALIQLSRAGVRFRMM